MKITTRSSIALGLLAGLTFVFAGWIVLAVLAAIAAPFVARADFQLSAVHIAVSAIATVALALISLTVLDSTGPDFSLEDACLEELELIESGLIERDEELVQELLDCVAGAE